MKPVVLPLLDESVAGRFWAKVEKTNCCWLWTSSTWGGGYGAFWDGQRMRNAHRFAYELLVGPVSTDLVIDHLCRNKRCVNPAHLEAVTDRENILRGEGPSAVNSRKTHCSHGHEFTQDNTLTRVRADRRPSRRCRECHREWMALYRSKAAA